MKLLPICINNKFNHMVDFEEPNNVNFVVSADNEGTLLKFFKRNNGVLVQETPSEKIYYVNDVTSNSTADSNGNVIDININIELVEQIKNLLETSRQKIAFEVNTTLLQTYWQIGKIIVEKGIYFFMSAFRIANLSANNVAILNRSVEQRMAQKYYADNFNDEFVDNLDVAEEVLV